MNRLFGSKTKTPKPTLDGAIKSTEDRISSLDIKLSKINAELSAYQQRLSKMREGPAKQSLKQRAMTLLRQRKQIEAQKDQLEQHAWGMTNAQMTTDNLKSTLATVDAMKEAKKEMQKVYGKVDIDKVEDLQDEMLDLVERGKELQEVLASGYDVPDAVSDSELDAELEALALDMEDEQYSMGAEGESTPGYLLGESGVPKFIDEPVEGEKQQEAAV
ncbi:CYFA0S01e16534g1_1 [Cyberlindnera fabianii]|uniref:CYFA0S01e16534g1_1 n=1 Tax=Cyberlindnera fabianii TaxID=36022 RepID=A0A061AQV1_CYBFA|nr:Vacuolar protein-sorting-associated protein 60 [Cyberlindnera fabianii]CDR37758.1 CYFA0S01e16534g1_1 [Cyberlindnera fabianii]